MVLYLLFIWRGMLWYVNHNSTWPLVVFNVNKILLEFLWAPRAVLYNWLYQIWLKSHAILTLNIYTEFFGILLIFVLLHVSAGGEELASPGVCIYNQMVPFIGWLGSLDRRGSHFYHYRSECDPVTIVT